MSERERRSELFCPAEFHGYVGVDVCLVFCRKEICSVFGALQKNEWRECEEIGVGGLGWRGWREANRK